MAIPIPDSGEPSSCIHHQVDYETLSHAFTYDVGGVCLYQLAVSF